MSPIEELEATIFINGAEAPSGRGDRLPHVNPATGKPQGSVPVATKSDVDRAVSAARNAARPWRALAAAQRRDLLIRLAMALEADAAMLSRLAILENGTPSRFAERLGAGSPAAWFRYYAGWVDKLDGDVAPALNPGARALNYSIPEPFGVVAVLTAFNAPMSFIGMKVAAALAAGNTVIIKPSELAPFTTAHFGRVCARVGVPDGVVNVIHGDGRTGTELVAHPGVDKITFTGSGDTARKILVAAAANLTPATLELGGKSAGLIFDDTDIDAAVTLCVTRGIANQAGQACLAPTRLLVQREVYDRTVESAAAACDRLVVGDPTQSETDVGPVISAHHRDRVLDVITQAVDRDGRLVSGGHGIGGDLAHGFFIEPTVFADVGRDSPLAQREIFGPVLSILPFDDEDDGVAIANNTPYGLAAYVFTDNITRAHRLADRLDAGSVSINTVAYPTPNIPFGGIKHSGHGREGGLEGIREMSRSKNVSVDLGEY